MNPDGSAVQAKAKEAWKQVKEVLDKDVVEKLVVPVAGRGECLGKKLEMGANRVTALTEAMDASDVPALKRLYTLLSSVKKFTEFRKALSEHVKVCFHVQTAAFC